jgi:selenide,water dikinase
MAFDLLSTIEYGGCSAKLPPGQLAELLADLPLLKDSRVMVDIQTHDDAGVYQMNEDTALIVTTDFFPPVCSDAYQFGAIAASNALSDVYAMGGDPILALNLMMFSAAKIPLSEFKEILRGGQEKAAEAGTLIMGGHTIDDHPPKYGLAVVGIVHPKKLITNAHVREGQHLILTKPLGTGVLVAAKKLNMANPENYQAALQLMAQLNKQGKEVMQRYGVTGATDITGFGLAGHAMQMANASGVSFRIETRKLPFINQVKELIDMGCIPGAAFRNLDYVKENVHYATSVDYLHQMITCDAQTSGGLLFAVDPLHSTQALQELHELGHQDAALIGKTVEKGNKAIYFE